MKLHNSNAVALDGASFIFKDELEKEISKLEKIIKNGGTDSIPKDRIKDALIIFLKSHSIQDISQARLICYGLLSKIDNNLSLIENQDYLFRLLNFVKTSKNKIRSFRRCYKGLLNNYFIFNPKVKSASEEGVLGWNFLREFLYDHRDNLFTNEINPDWVETLIKHENLLQNDPCSRYGLEALNGDRSIFDEIKNKLEIQDDSWVMSELVNAQIDSAVKLNDHDFKNSIKNLLDLLKEHDFVNECLGKIINRYTKCSDTSVNKELRDFSVVRWKNPWLKGNEFRWATVSSEGKQLVSTWLKLHLITEFFAFLSEDGSNDTRRVDFWKAYHDDIEDMYFALGPDSFGDDSLNAVQIRKEMAGLLLRLDNSGVSSNNAFIMKIRDYYFVEFGKAGNAAYVFDSKQSMPFTLQNTISISGDSKHLKNRTSKSFVQRLIHKDSNYGIWEEEFEDFISEKLKVKKIKPKMSSVDSGSDITVSKTIFNDKKAQQSIFDSNKINFSVSDLKLFAKQNNFQIFDNKNEGGLIWVFSSDHQFGKLEKQLLESWGFAWSDKKKAYYK